MSRADLPTPFDVDHLRRRAKELREAVLAGDRLARERARKAHPRFGTARLTDAEVARFTLRDAQLCLARELGFDGWPAVLAHAQGAAPDRPWRRWPDDPDARIRARAGEAARAAGLSHVGPDQVLGALVRPPAEGPAATVLTDMGLTWERWLDQHRRAAGAGAGGSGDLRFSPSWYGLVGVASGIALAAGAGALGDEHVLLALAYTSRSRSPGTLDFHGLDADAVVVALAGHGVAASDLRPPARAPAIGAFGPRVYFPEADFGAVTQALFRRYPPGSGYWGFNIDPDDRRHFVDGEADLDIEAIVRGAVADPAGVTVGPAPPGRPPSGPGEAPGPGQAS